MTMAFKNYINTATLRKQREIRFKMAEGKCEWCGNKAEHIHHIDKKTHNHSIENLVALCKDCHLKKAHKTGEKWTEARRSAKSITLFIKKYGLSAKEIADLLNEPVSKINYWHSQGNLKNKILLLAPYNIIFSKFKKLLHN